MRRLALVIAMVLVVLGASPAAASDEKLEVEGTYVAYYDLSTLSLSPMGPHKCLLELDAAIEFFGDLSGIAAGSYDVLVWASCEETAASPPGVLKARFWYDGAAEVTLDGFDAEARVKYRGVEGEPYAPGEFEGQMNFTGGVNGMLKVEATGFIVSYSGFIHVR